MEVLELAKHELLQAALLMAGSAFAIDSSDGFFDLVRAESRVHHDEAHLLGRLFLDLRLCHPCELHPEL